jgi:cell pole-organizing protein PopZ
MSAANPSYDLDALHRAQRAYEPSMEEILASIRNIISEERPGAGALPAATPLAEAAPPPLAEAAGRRDQPIERAEPPAMPRVVWPKPGAEAAPERAPEPPSREAQSAALGPTGDAEPAPEDAAQDDRLISPETNAAIVHSFDALSVSVALQNSTLIEDAVRDMIRPMLKAWLDDHLPTMVENLVRAEIQRVARGGR